MRAVCCLCLITRELCRQPWLKLQIDMDSLKLLTFSAFICAFICLTNSINIYACDNHVFCQGKILRAVQMAKVFDDAKTFVDMRMKYDISDIQRNFSALGLKPSKEKIRKFVVDNFSPAGNDLEPFDPEDLIEKPERLKKIRDEKLRKWAFALNDLWKKLGRNITHEAREQSERSSLIIIPNPFIIPGGRFREYYYWDSYWILHGILTCGMYKTAKGMVMNYLDLVHRFGFVPNGGRVYYLNRSQPPFLIQMVDLYYSYTKDLDFVGKNLKTLEKEYEFWEKYRTVRVNVSGVQHSFAVYKANMTSPRPESYWNDYEVGKKLTDKHMKWRFYQAVASAAESGWDFSSRWFDQSDDKVGKFESIHTMDIIPVDLNSILYKNAISLSKFSHLTGDQSNGKKYQQLANQRWRAIEALLWNEAAGAWADYDVTIESNTKAFYASVVVPLWAGLAQGNSTREELVFATMKHAKVLDFPGGFPTSLNLSGQQWDYPNAWPPLQHMLIIGLANCSSISLQNEAKKLAKSWVLGNWKGYERTNYMFEKYNVTSQGNTGRGGEYKPQVGFGWTNGVILDLLVRFPDIKVENNGVKVGAAMGQLCNLVLALLLLNCL